MSNRLDDPQKFLSFKDEGCFNGQITRELERHRPGKCFKTSGHMFSGGSRGIPDHVGRLGDLSYFLENKVLKSSRTPTTIPDAWSVAQKMALQELWLCPGPHATGGMLGIQGISEVVVVVGVLTPHILYRSRVSPRPPGDHQFYCLRPPLEPHQRELCGWEPVGSFVEVLERMAAFHATCSGLSESIQGWKVEEGKTRRPRDRGGPGRRRRSVPEHRDLDD